MKKSVKNELSRLRKADEKLKKLQKGNRDRTRKYRKKQSTEGKKHVTFLLSESLHDKIKKEGKKLGLTQSQIVERILRKFFEERQKRKPLKLKPPSKKSTLKRTKMDLRKYLTKKKRA